MDAIQKFIEETRAGYVDPQHTRRKEILDLHKALDMLEVMLGTLENYAREHCVAGHCKYDSSIATDALLKCEKIASGE